MHYLQEIIKQLPKNLEFIDLYLDENNLGEKVENMKNLGNSL